MAEVKLKYGYTKIANKLIENLCIRDFNKRELVLIMLIMRLSYGFHKKQAYIKPKSWLSVCGFYKSDISNTLTNLINKGVIVYHGNNVYSLNKNYDEWNVNYSKNFVETKFTSLKALQFCKQNTNENGSEILTNDKQNTYDQEAKHLPNIKNSKRNTYYEVSEILTKNENKEVKHLPTQDENATGASDNIDHKEISKDIIKHTIKDIYKDENTINSNTKNFDPYFNNPVIEVFKNEYVKVFKKSNCYLDNIKINKLTEIYLEDKNFINQIPEILNKFSKIRFSNGIGAPTLKWLINDGAWASILNGEYDQYIVDENSESEETGWKL